MDWKLIVGFLIIFGGIGEMVATSNGYKTGVTTSNPIYPQIGVFIFMLLGSYLVYGGFKDRKEKED